MFYEETFEASVRFGLEVQRTLFDERSDYQRVEVVETTRFGRMLVIDGIFMTSEKDEFYYHEMLVQPAMNTVRRPERVLIIGGGDGGSAREVLRHDSVKTCVMIELDELVVTASREYLPTIGTAFDDPRLDLRFDDGIAYVKNSDEERFDVVLVDGTDPIGPGEVLFDEAFFAGAKRMLAPHGVMALQSESPIYFEADFLSTQHKLKKLFTNVAPYFGPVPIYSGGIWSWTYCSDECDPLVVDEARGQPIADGSQYYNLDVHRGAFAQPNTIRRALAQPAPAERDLTE